MSMVSMIYSLLVGTDDDEVVWDSNLWLTKIVRIKNCFWRYVSAFLL